MLRMQIERYVVMNSLLRTRMGMVAASMAIGLSVAACSAEPTVEPAPITPTTTKDFVGGCDKYLVYAQNRWPPLGAAVREEPDVLAPKLDPGFAGNEAIAVDGWVDTHKPVYKTNPPPWNSGVWFHLANRAGWVSFPGVRGAPTTPDMSGLNPDGGTPAEKPADCEGTYVPR